MHMGGDVLQRCSMMGSSTELAFFEDLIAQSRHACMPLWR